MTDHFEFIKPLIHNMSEQGGHLRVDFRCPVTGETFSASGPLAPSNAAGSRIKNQVVREVQRSAMYEVRRSVLGALRGVFGGGTVGRVVSRAAHSAIPTHTGTSNHSRAAPQVTEADRQAAIVTAFSRVQGAFVWDNQNVRWISASAMPERSSDAFSAQLEGAPITERYDKGVMARMLIEIARADGRLAEEERAFLTDTIPPELGSLQSIAARPPLDRVELDEVTVGPVRETLLTLAWTAALTDESLTDAERSRLGEFAAGLGISRHRADELQRMAQTFVFDKALERASFLGYNQQTVGEAMGVADRIGLSREDAMRAEVRFRKANGIF